MFEVSFAGFEGAFVCSCITGITRYTASCFPSAIDLLSRGVVDLKPLITAQFPLSRAKEAFEAVASGKEMKVIIKNQEI
jgi:D-xylulose reductase